MPTATLPPPSERQDRLFTRADYHAMASAGILSENDRVELIEGKILTMMPIGPWHASSALRLTKLLNNIYQDRALVAAGNPVGLGNHSEPQPDISVLRRKDDYYSSGHPEAKDVLLLIEISDSTVHFDLGKKRRLYASQSVMEYWVVDGQRHCIHVFRNPQQGEFNEERIFRPGELIPLPECEGAALEVNATGV